MEQFKKMPISKFLGHPSVHASSILFGPTSLCRVLRKATTSQIQETVGPRCASVPVPRFHPIIALSQTIYHILCHRELEFDGLHRHRPLQLY
jgi:hypothetical protein